MRKTTMTFWILPAIVLGLSGCKEAEGNSTLSDQPAPPPLLQTQRQQAAPVESPLVIDPPRYELGAVPIHGGNVEMLFQVKNESSEPLVLAVVYSSCACTSAVLLFNDDSKAGPFGMPGHELPNKIERAVAPGEEFQVQVRFDPAAHGLAGVGKVERFVFLETAEGASVRLEFGAEIVVE